MLSWLLVLFDIIKCCLQLGAKHSHSCIGVTKYKKTYKVDVKLSFITTSHKYCFAGAWNISHNSIFVFITLWQHHKQSKLISNILEDTPTKQKIATGTETLSICYKPTKVDKISRQRLLVLVPNKICSSRKFTFE